MHMQDDLLTREELASKLKMTPRNIQFLEKDGLPCIRIGHKTVRYKYEEVLKWLDKNKTNK